MEETEQARLYGPWRGRTPAEAAELLKGYAGRWWVAGGWAVEAFTGVPRRHSDLDLGIPRADVAGLHRHVAGLLDVWQADHGALRPQLDADGAVPLTCGNLWLRPSGAEPWEYDVLLMSTTGTTWTYKRDDRVRLPVDDVLWSKDGLAYLRPEVQLLHKAPGLRPKDQADFEACLPLLPAPARHWLQVALETAHPDHPWLWAL